MIELQQNREKLSLGRGWGFVGYLPLYLRGAGWEPTQADGALAAFYGISLCFAMPFSISSDRLQLRRGYLVLAALLLATGVGLLGTVQGAWVWGVVLLGGGIFDAFMAIYQATVMEISAVGRLYAGSALGLAAMLCEAGGIASPALGNSLSRFGPQVPFFFWAGLALVATLIVWQLPKSFHEA